MAAAVGSCCCTSHHARGMSDCLHTRVSACGLQELYNYLTDALVEYTYDTSRLGKATGCAKAIHMAPSRLGWTGQDLGSLQPRILACYAAPCETAAPWQHFWRQAMPGLPHQFALRVELEMTRGDLLSPYDRPDIGPYLSIIGTLTTPSPLPMPALCKLKLSAS